MVGRVNRIFRRAVVLAAAAVACSSAPATAAGGEVVPGPAAEASESAPDAAGQCPAVTVLAARGSEQDEDLVPTRYSDSAPWASNGFEAPTLRDFLQLSEQRHLTETGESLMAQVDVLALDDTVYPAALPLPALAEEGEELALDETARRVHELLSRTPAHQIAGEAAQAVMASVDSGIRGTGDVIAEYEATTGCQPGYILLGYSQGAVVLTAQEQELHESGRLLGAIYLGNPLLAAGDPSTVGQGRSGGLLGPVAERVLPTAPIPNRVNYCLAGDFVCAPTVDAATGALGDGGGAHATYFLNEEFSADDLAVTDAFASWVTAAA